MTLADATTTTSASAHLAHILEAGGVLIVTLVAVALGDWIRARRARAPQPGAVAAMPRDARIVVCAAMTSGAAAVHLVVTPVHFAEAVIYGVFFVITASVQLSYAAWLTYRPSRKLLAAGMVANAGLVVLWLFSRLVEVPLGPGAGERESFSGLDVLASAFEVCFVIAAALALLHATSRVRMRRAFVPACLAVVAALISVTVVAYPPS